MRALAVGMVCLGLAACDTPNFRTSQFQFGTATTLAATGNLRFVSERDRLLPDEPVQRVACSEPSPDYAVTATTDIELSAKTAVPQAPIENATANINVAEAFQKLDGRSKGVLALRDGLYAACQAYTNGQIGKDAYSIILSQYGSLLVALMSETAPNAAPKDPGTAQAASVIRAQRSAATFAAVLVACINGHDPTRSTVHGASRNPLLTPAYCRGVLSRAANRA
jgi:hypothetical protein